MCGVSSVLFMSDGSWRFENAAELSPVGAQSAPIVASPIEGEDVQCVSVVAATPSRRHSRRGVKRRRGADGCDGEEEPAVKPDPDACTFPAPDSSTLPSASFNASAVGTPTDTDSTANNVRRARSRGALKEESQHLPVANSTFMSSSASSCAASANAEHRGRRELTRRRDRAGSEQTEQRADADDKSPSSRRLHERQPLSSPVTVKRERRSSSSSSSDTSDSGSGSGSDDESHEEQSKSSEQDDSESSDEDDVWHDASDQPFS